MSNEIREMGLDTKFKPIAEMNDEEFDSFLYHKRIVGERAKEMSRLRRQQREARMPKCRCGNTLSLERQNKGVRECPQCERAKLDAQRRRTLETFADERMERES